MQIIRILSCLVNENGVVAAYIYVIMGSRVPTMGEQMLRFRSESSSNRPPECAVHFSESEGPNRTCDSGAKLCSRSRFGGVRVIIIRIFSYTVFPRLRILSCQVVENDGMARVLAPQLCSRSSFGGVIVIIIRIFSYTGFHRLRILSCQVVENDGMA